MRKTAVEYKEKRVRADKATQGPVQHLGSTHMKTKDTVGTSAKKLNKGPEATYKHVLAFSKTGEASLFMIKNYKAFVWIIRNPSPMCPILYVLDTGADPNLISVDDLDSTSLDSIRQLYMVCNALRIPDIPRASDINLKGFRANPHRLRMAESHTLVNFIVVGETYFPRTFRHDVYRQIHKIDTPGRTENCTLPLPAGTNTNGTGGSW